MTTTAQNNQVLVGNNPLSYPVLTDGTYDINQGDQVYWDSSGHVVKPVDTNGHAATFAGVAAQSSYMNPYGTKIYPQGSIEVWTKGKYTFKTTVGDTLNHGDPVYLGADAQTVTNQDPGGGNVIGYVWLPLGGTAVTGATGTNIDVVIKALFPFAGV